MAKKEVEKQLDVMKEELDEKLKSVLPQMNTLLLFEFLTDEAFIPDFIKVCKDLGVDRWEVIDLIKEEMLDIALAKYEDRDKELIKDIELIPVPYLTQKMELKDKTQVLFNVFAEYPEVVKQIETQSLFVLSCVMKESVNSILSSEVMLFEECKGDK